MKHPIQLKPIIIFTIIAIVGSVIPILLPIINGQQELTSIHIIASISIGILITAYAYKNRSIINKLDSNETGEYSRTIKTLIFGRKEKNSSKPDQK